MKKCKSCNKNLPLESFYFQKSSKDLLRGTCKHCVKTQSAERYQKNKGRRAETNRLWYQQNKHSTIERSRIWAIENPEKIRAKRWRRRTVSKSVLSDHQPFSQNLIRSIFKKCLACGRGDDLTIDHVLPLAVGGTNTLGNYQVLCRSCNSSKGVRAVDYRLDWCESTSRK